MPLWILLTSNIYPASFVPYAHTLKDSGASDVSNTSLSPFKGYYSDSQAGQRGLIRIACFSIQVQQPWLLLQYNSSDIENVGIDRVEESLLSTSQI